MKNFIFWKKFEKNFFSFFFLKKNFFSVFFYFSHFHIFLIILTPINPEFLRKNFFWKSGFRIQNLEFMLLKAPDVSRPWFSCSSWNFMIFDTHQYRISPNFFFSKSGFRIQNSECTLRKAPESSRFWFSNSPWNFMNFDTNHAPIPSRWFSPRGTPKASEALGSWIPRIQIFPKPLMISIKIFQISRRFQKWQWELSKLKIMWATSKKVQLLAVSDPIWRQERVVSPMGMSISFLSQKKGKGERKREQKYNKLGSLSANFSTLFRLLRL